jgi:intergrase/recombinase
MQAWQTGYIASRLQRGAMCREDDWQDGRTEKDYCQAIQTGMADRQSDQRDRQDSRFRIFI